MPRGPTTRSTSRATQGKSGEAAAIRVKVNGYDVSDRGRIH
ncbi:Lsr2 family protein [Kocuria dechangensis]|nr:Lsr2 family protein [Kocuria dechangensis]